MNLSLHLSSSVFSFCRGGPCIKFWFVERFQLSVPRSQWGYTHCLSCRKNHHLTQKKLSDSNLCSLLSVPLLFRRLCFKCMLWELNQFVGPCFAMSKFERFLWMDFLSRFMFHHLAILWRLSQKHVKHRSQRESCRFNRTRCSLGPNCRHINN